ncbi:hypothetical protein HJFPF1_10960 [Paramyrothecium foliicola]|nr:hypothetical protein HJFPF1_10960 [Paramyrothecium foliicola]
MDDWKTRLPFVTVPPGAEGLTMSRTITWEQLLQYLGQRLLLGKKPQPGAEYELYFSTGRRETFIDRRNWGDLGSDLKDKRLVNLVNPKLNGVEDPAPPSPPTMLLYYACGDEMR